MKDSLSLIERCTTRKISLEDLKLDAKNYRLNKKLTTDKQLEDYFWTDEKEATNVLYSQIKSAKGLYEDPIITQDGTVKEGNRRLVCLRQLQKEARAGQLEGVAKNHYDYVKCKILPTDATSKEILMMLAYIHSIGKKKWDAYNKAEVVALLHDVEKASYDELSQELGMAKITLIRIVNAYNATKAYGKKYPEPADWFRSFTYMDELFKRRSLKTWREDEKNLEQFFVWVHEGRLDDVREVRHLDKIIFNLRARKIFDEKKSSEAYDEALTYVISIDPTAQDANFRKISRTIEAIQSFDRKSIVKIMNDDSRFKLLKDLQHEINSLVRDIESMRRANKKEEAYL